MTSCPHCHAALAPGKAPEGRYRCPRCQHPLRLERGDVRPTAERPRPARPDPILPNALLRDDVLGEHASDEGLGPAVRGPRSIGVGSLVARRLIVVDQTLVVELARSLMVDHDVHCLPVVDEGRRPLGIITSTDLLRPVPGKLPVRTIMTRPVHTIGSDEPVGRAARRMLELRVHHLVVVDGAGLVLGVLSSFDLLRSIEGDRPDPAPDP